LEVLEKICQCNPNITPPKNSYAYF